MSVSQKISPWKWIPSLYFAQGIPYVTVMTIAVILYKRMGISNTDIALYTSWLYLPWVLKPLWSPFIDILKTKRWWIVSMQMLIGAGLAGVAFCIPVPFFFQATLAFFWLLAFSSATHDIAADGFYMLALDSHEQSLYVGIRNTFYRIAMITGQGLLIMLAGTLELHTGNTPVDFNVRTVPGTPVSSSNTTDNGDFIISPATLILPVTAEKQNDSITFLAKTANVENRFTPNENYPEYRPPSEKEGTIGVIKIRLKEKPRDGKKVILNTSFRNGDKSIQIISGERLVFDENNWGKEACIIIQADPKLEKESTASFRGTAGNIPLAWSITFFVLSGAFIMLCLYHKYALPHPAGDKATSNIHTAKAIWKEFIRTFVSFFKKKEIATGLFFMLTFRLSESQLLKLASPFMLDPREAGGLGLTTGEVGLVYGTVGVLALTIGGIMGGIAASRQGLKFWLWPMTLAITLPNLVYVYLSYVQPDSLILINSAVAIEQFGYGFGFTAYMLYMISFADGEHKTAHYAICTAFMALGMMLPGMISGWLQDLIGYRHFFIWVMLCTLPAYFSVALLKINPKFGKK